MKEFILIETQNGPELIDSKPMAYYATEEEAVEAALEIFGEDSWSVQEGDKGFYLTAPVN